MKYIFFLTIFLLLFFSFSLSAQFDTDRQPTLKIKFAEGSPIPDSVVVRYFPNYYSASGLSPSNLVSRERDSDGSFCVDMPGDQPIYPVIFYFMYGKWPYKSTSNKYFYYYVQPDDQIQVVVNARLDSIRDNASMDLSFTGKGAKKMEICELMNAIKYEEAIKSKQKFDQFFGKNGQDYSLLKIGALDFYTPDHLSAYFEEEMRDQKNLEKRLVDFLNSYRSQLGEDMYHFYEIEFCTSLNFTSKIYRIFEQATNLETKRAILAQYLKKRDLLKIPLPGPDNSLYKYGIDYRFRFERFLSHDLYFKNLGRYPLKVYYAALRNINHTELREIMLTRLFFNKGGVHTTANETWVDYLDDAVLSVKDPELNSVLVHQRIFIPGSKIENYTFQDTMGGNFELASLEGKVYLLDFYYYGCAPCMNFSDRFSEEVLPEFLDNPHFKILSINPINDRNYWMRSIQSGNYTYPGSIDLTTNLRMKHPLLKKYGIVGFPWVVLVDRQGQVLDFNVTGKKSGEISEMIRRALASGF